jgi:hypothetical protein
MIRKLIIFIVIIIALILLGEDKDGQSAFFFIAIGIVDIIFCIIKRKKEIKNEFAKTDKIHMVRIKDIINIYNNVKEEMKESGHFKQMVEIEGTVKSGNYSRDELYVQDVSSKILVKTNNASCYNNMGKPFKQLSNITLPNDTNVYIVGEVWDDFEGLYIREPKDSDNPFIIAYTSKQKYLQARLRAVWRIPAIAIILILFGLMMILTPRNPEQNKNSKPDSTLENKNINISE